MGLDAITIFANINKDLFPSSENAILCIRSSVGQHKSKTFSWQAFFCLFLKKMP